MPDTKLIPVPFVCEAVADLKVVAVRADQIYLVLGKTARGDGQGGFYFWDAASTAAEDLTTMNVVQSTGRNTGRWLRVFTRSMTQQPVMLIGSATIAQTAAIQIALGIREVTVSLAGATVGTKYAFFAVSYRLNGGASTPGRPSGYSIIDCVCNTAGQITVSLNAPLLSIGQSYQITGDVVTFNL